MLGNLFRQRSHYVYNYKPRYYDPKKERMEKLKTDHISAYSSGAFFEKSALKAQWARKKKSSANKNVNIRLAIIITVLITLAFYIFGLDRLL